MSVSTNADDVLNEDFLSEEHLKYRENSNISIEPNDMDSENEERQVSIDVLKSFIICE